MLTTINIVAGTHHLVNDASSQVQLIIELFVAPACVPAVHARICAQEWHERGVIERGPGLPRPSDDDVGWLVFAIVFGWHGCGCSIACVECGFGLH
jgi:hypothetical protein